MTTFFSNLWTGISNNKLVSSVCAGCAAVLTAVVSFFGQHSDFWLIVGVFAAVALVVLAVVQKTKLWISVASVVSVLMGIAVYLRYFDVPTIPAVSLPAASGIPLVLGLQVAAAALLVAAAIAAIWRRRVWVARLASGLAVAGVLCLAVLAFGVAGNVSVAPSDVPDTIVEFAKYVAWHNKSQESGNATVTTWHDSTRETRVAASRDGEALLKDFRLKVQNGQLVPMNKKGEENLAMLRNAYEN